MKSLPSWAQTLIALLVFVLVFVVLNQVKPRHPIIPRGIFLPALEKTFPMKSSATQVMYLHAPQAQLIGHINVEMHTTDPDQAVKAATLARAVELAQKNGADRLLFVGDGFNPEMSSYILEASAYRMP